MLKAGLVIAGAAAAVVGIGAVVGIPMVESRLDGRHEQEATYPTGRDAKADLDSVPAWLPDGATHVRYKMTTAGGDRLLVADLPDGRLPGDCVPARGHVHPGMTASWFPKGAAHKATVRCGMYSGYTDGTKLVAWQHDHDVREAGQVPRPR
ncbi:MAG: hypothetical protein HOV68_28050 [Streptomycetaceae bacterium]|nr:hypothetical protein [Streptomycetaceae bacterium]